MNCQTVVGCWNTTIAGAVGGMDSAVGWLKPDACSTKPSDTTVVTQNIPLPPRHQDSVSIMLIEDDIDLGEELCRGLSQFGYEVTHSRVQHGRGG